MKKPQLKDFTGNRQEKGRKYREALKKYREFIKKNKPVNNDPRPVWKKGESREEFRKRLLPWRERQEQKRIQERKDRLKKEGKKDTSRGVRPDRKTSNKTSKDLKIKSTAKDRVGKVNLNSAEYKEAKKSNEQPVKYQTEEKNVPVEEDKEDNQGNNKEKVTPKYKQVTQEELDKKIAEGKKEKKSEGSGKKESRWIRNPKTKSLVRRTSQKGKQLLKIKSRIDARNKKLFGDKKKKKKK